MDDKIDIVAGDLGYQLSLEIFKVKSNCTRSLYILLYFPVFFTFNYYTWSTYLWMISLYVGSKNHLFNSYQNGNFVKLKQ
jgi:hypothetical protein